MCSWRRGTPMISWTPALQLHISDNSTLVDDQQRHGGERLDELSARAVHDGIGQLVEQHMGFAIEHAIALLNGGLADGLRQVALAGAAGPEKQCVFALADEGTCGQVEYQAALHLGIEVEVEVIKRLLRITEGGLRAPS